MSIIRRILATTDGEVGAAIREIRKIVDKKTISNFLVYNFPTHFSEEKLPLGWFDFY
ncbi:MAG: hypothetical protein FWG98_06275 [Candidatus Cloacimonetes bacterium]|nr:hypothetical protein [Candidatus Cloacimonadota bacterium]